MDGERGLELFAAKPGQHNEDSISVDGPALDEGSRLHACELMGEAALVPAHDLGKRVLTHLAFADGRETRKDTVVGAGEAGGLSKVAADAAEYVFKHELKGMPDAELVRGKRFCGHDCGKDINVGLT